jgi:S-adenosylmethionine synthetase
MAHQRILFTSESVTEGHPDKVADQISDSILDAYISQDPNSRVACETLVTTGLAVIAGEITSRGHVDYQEVVRKAIKDIGYTQSSLGFDYRSCAVLVSVGRQSPDISQGVTEGQGKFKEQGAGDQGMMFGYACNETKECMPLSISLAQRLAEQMARVRKNGTLPFLGPDGKTQVTVEYDNNNRPTRIDTIILSSQHDERATEKMIEEGLREAVMQPIVPKDLIDKNTKVYVNPTGRFVVGGPHGDSGLTGRKIIVDTYGGHGAHGGGAFSGKDPTKVDRSAAYMARYMAKNVVAAGLADRCLVQLAYAIGVADPVSVYLTTYGTAKAKEETIATALREIFPLKPAQIIETLQLKRPIYALTAAYGHFGRELPEFNWERTDRVDELKRLCR